MWHALSLFDRISFYFLCHFFRNLTIFICFTSKINVYCIILRSWTVGQRYYTRMLRILRHNRHAYTQTWCCTVRQKFWKLWALWKDVYSIRFLDYAREAIHTHLLNTVTTVKEELFPIRNYRQASWFETNYVFKNQLTLYFIIWY